MKKKMEDEKVAVSIRMPIKTKYGILEQYENLSEGINNLLDWALTAKPSSKKETMLFILRAIPEEHWHIFKTYIPKEFNEAIIARRNIDKELCGNSILQLEDSTAIDYLSKAKLLEGVYKFNNSLKWWSTEKHYKFKLGKAKVDTWVKEDDYGYDYNLRFIGE